MKHLLCNVLDVGAGVLKLDPLGGELSREDMDSLFLKRERVVVIPALDILRGLSEEESRKLRHLVIQQGSHE